LVEYKTAADVGGGTISPIIIDTNVIATIRRRKKVDRRRLTVDMTALLLRVEYAVFTLRSSELHTDIFM
jgi:hypothetical protein